MWQSRTERTLCQLSLSVLEAASGSFVALSLPSLPAFCSALLLLSGFLFYFGDVQAGSSSSPAGMSPWVLAGWLLVGAVHSSALGVPEEPLAETRPSFRCQGRFQDPFSDRRLCHLSLWCLSLPASPFCPLNSLFVSLFVFAPHGCSVPGSLKECIRSSGTGVSVGSCLKWERILSPLQELEELLTDPDAFVCIFVFCFVC